MERTLRQLAAVASKHGVPILCAGDVFDIWNPPPELITFAMRVLPPMYAIPGQHDLPHHSWQHRERGAFWTLVQAGIIDPLMPSTWTEINGLSVTGVPWGLPPTPVTSKQANMRNVGVIHAFCWKDASTSWRGAAPGYQVWNHPAVKAGYDVAVFGDNHQAFSCRADRTLVVNCGSLMRRRANESGQRCVWLLYDDLTARAVILPTEDERFQLPEQGYDQIWDSGEFVASLAALEDTGGDFESAMKAAIDAAPPEQQPWLLKWLGGARDAENTAAAR